MRAHIIKVGQQLAVVLPDSYCKDGGLTEGSPIDLDVGKTALTVRPVRYGVGDLIARLASPDAPPGPQPSRAEPPTIAPAKVTKHGL
ncbi:MAG: AbrB/MazE/SpoVT family DNA-binding domain-containing protein [Alphaproteobacteria bacterium]